VKTHKKNLLSGRMKKISPFILIITAAVVISAGIFSVAAAAGSSGGYSSKDEVVYGNLSDSGSVKSVYVVSSFEMKKKNKVTDHGDYSKTENLTNDSRIIQDGDRITFTASEGIFFYKGKMKESKLPWDIKVLYFLDGRPVNGSELAGASGDLEIRVDTSAGSKAYKDYYDNYLIQISFTLDPAKCSSIRGDGATIADSGSSRIVTFSVMPGHSGSVLLKAKAEDFSMDGISISALPFSASLDLPGENTFRKEFTPLSYAVSRLEEGTADMKKGLKKLDSGSDQLVSASAQIKKALEMTAASLSGGQGGYSQDDLRRLSAAFSDAETTLSELVASIPDGDLSQADFDALKTAVTSGGGTADDTENLEMLISTYEAAQRLKNTYSSLSPVFGSVTPALNSLTENADILSGNISALSREYGSFHKGLKNYSEGTEELYEGAGSLDSGVSGLSGAVSEMPSQMSEAMKKLFSAYDTSGYSPESFVSPENRKVRLVQFVIKTDSIGNAEKSVQSADSSDRKKSFLDRLRALF